MADACMYTLHALAHVVHGADAVLSTSKAPYHLPVVIAVPLLALLPLVLVHGLLSLLHHAARLQLLPLHVPIQIDLTNPLLQIALCHHI